MGQEGPCFGRKADLGLNSSILPYQLGATGQLFQPPAVAVLCVMQGHWHLLSGLLGGLSGIMWSTDTGSNTQEKHHKRGSPAPPALLAWAYASSFQKENSGYAKGTSYVGLYYKQVSFTGSSWTGVSPTVSMLLIRKWKLKEFKCFSIVTLTQWCNCD